MNKNYFEIRIIISKPKHREKKKKFETEFENFGKFFNISQSVTNTSASHFTIF